MSFTFTTLKSAIQDYTENTETTFVNDLTTIIKQAEQRILDSVQLPVFRKNQTGTFTSSNSYLATPTDYLYPYSLAVLNSDSEYSFLLNKDVNFIREAYPAAATTGLPVHYAQFNNSYFIVGPTPDSGYTVEIHYFYRPQSITETSDGTSWLGTNAPDALLYGSLVEAATFLKLDPTEIQMFEARFGNAVGALKTIFETLGNIDEYRYDNIRGVPG